MVFGRVLGPVSDYDETLRCASTISFGVIMQTDLCCLRSLACVCSCCGFIRLLVCLRVLVLVRACLFVHMFALSFGRLFVRLLVYLLI